MNFVLAILSSKAIAAIFDEQLNWIARVEWSQTEGAELAQQLDEQTKRLLSDAKISPAQIKKIFGLQGPGSFTGLRVCASFLKGYSTALGVPLVGIPTFRLFGEPFAISLRASRAAKLTLDECVEQGYKFIEVTSDREVRIVERPTTKLVLGLKDRPLWPSIEEVSRAMKNAQDLSGFEINYGYDPMYLES